MDETLSTQERAQLIYEHLKRSLDSGRMKGLEEFTMGGITACCAILDIRNPYTGKKFEGDLRDMGK